MLVKSAHVHNRTCLAQLCAAAETLSVKHLSAHSGISILYVSFVCVGGGLIQRMVQRIDYMTTCLNQVQVEPQLQGRGRSQAPAADSRTAAKANF